MKRELWIPACMMLLFVFLILVISGAAFADDGISRAILRIQSPSSDGRMGRNAGAYMRRQAGIHDRILHIELLQIRYARYRNQACPGATNSILNSPLGFNA